ncbi:MAG: hypothetical protein IPP19_09995 [Verrucomicrobia bacterium]|nr:hypothetical protein [Verrucomicrobiota bacterium]
MQLFMLPTELYRVGSSSSPKLDRVRIPRDIAFTNTYQENGMVWIRAGLHGASLFTLNGIKEKMQFFDPEDMVWQLPRTINVPFGLGMKNDHSDHYVIHPLQNMPLDEFKGKVAELAKQAKAFIKVKSLAHV